MPATSANLGTGFDSVGLALSIYNYLEIKEGTDNGEKVVIHGPAGVPVGEDNLIYRTISDFFKWAGKEMPPLTMWQNDHIPMTRGLGSSAACVVSGLMAGNALAEMDLSREDLIQMAAQIEGHPDNSTPALIGGLTVGAMTEERLEYVRLPDESWKALKFALMVPAFELSTEKARALLPEEYPRRDVVHNTARVALLMASLMAGDFQKLFYALDDRIHQPYRSHLVPDMDVIFEEARKNGAYNAFLSGAGPSLIAVTEDEGFILKMTEFLRKLPNNWAVSWVAPDYEGATIQGS